MNRRCIWLAIIFIFFHCKVLASGDIYRMPDDFVNVSDLIPGIVVDMRYYGVDNFVGRKIDGYECPVALLTRGAAIALKKAFDILWQQGYILKIWDAYRPQSAVEHFKRWARDISDQAKKEIFYPYVDKEKLFDLGYIADKSSHSRGSTVDVTIVQKTSFEEVDMGSGFDFFGCISHIDTDLITEEQKNNRKILASALAAAGFESYPFEWWHFTLINEKYPNVYFDFLVR